MFEYDEKGKSFIVSRKELTKRFPYKNFPDKVYDFIYYTELILNSSVEIDSKYQMRVRLDINEPILVESDFWNRLINGYEKIKPIEENLIECKNIPVKIEPVVVNNEVNYIITIDWNILNHFIKTHYNIKLPFSVIKTIMRRTGFDNDEIYRRSSKFFTSEHLTKQFNNIIEEMEDIIIIAVDQYKMDISIWLENVEDTEYLSENHFTESNQINENDDVSF